MINTAHEEGEFISPTLLRSESDGTIRVILNYKSLNQTLEYNFKMETIHSVAHLIQQNYMLKIDLKDEYYSVKEVHKTHKVPYHCLKIGGNHYSYLHRSSYNIRRDI